MYCCRFFSYRLIMLVVLDAVSVSYLFSMRTVYLLNNTLFLFLPFFAPKGVIHAVIVLWWRHRVDGVTVIPPDRGLNVL